MSIESNDNLPALVAEIKNANECADLGLYAHITPDNFPLIASDPERLVITRLRAVRAHANNLSGVAYLFREDSDVATRVSQRIESLYESEKNAVLALYTDSIPEEVKVGLFFLNNSEGSTLDAIVGNGLIEQLTPRTIPGLAALSQSELAALQLTTLMNAHTKWTAIAVFARSGRTGLQSGGDYLEDTTELAEKMCIQIRVQMESISNSILGNK